MVKLGYVSGHIPGDYRYCDTIEVRFEKNERVKVVLKEYGAVGGMDSFGGTSLSSERVVYCTKKCKGGELVAEIKRLARGTLVERYGKPTKSFRWCTGEVGLSAKRAQDALDSMSNDDK